jgi:hypothetical protein
MELNVTLSLAVSCAVCGAVAGARQFLCSALQQVTMNH